MRHLFVAFALAVLVALPGAPLASLAQGQEPLPSDRPPDRDLPDRDLPDQDLPDRQLPDTDLPDQDLPDTDLPDQDLSSGEDL